MCDTHGLLLCISNIGKFVWDYVQFLFGFFIPGCYIDSVLCTTLFNIKARSKPQVRFLEANDCARLVATHPISVQRYVPF